MKIIGLQAENIKKLKAVNIVPTGNVIKLSGANEQGKSSILDAITMALGGTKMLPEKPIREGQESAVTRVDLGDLIVTRRFSLGSDSLTVKNKENAKYPSPQAMLDSLIGKLSFDPLAFITNEKKQVETLLNVVNIPVDYNNLKTLCGYEIKQEANPLDAINKAIALVKSNRSDINKDLTRSKKTLESYGTPQYAKAVIIQELFAEKQSITAKIESIKAKEEILDNLQARVIQGEKTLLSIDAELERLRLQKDSIANELQSNRDKYAGFKTQLSTVQRPTYDDIDAKIAAADKTNAAARKYEEYTKLKESTETIGEEYKQLGDNLRQLEDYKESLLNNTKFPIDGLGFNDGMVTFKGLPLSQASSAEQLGIGMAVGMALNPDLRIIIIRDASLLDSKHMAVIEQMAKDNDYQVWMEIVDETGTVGLYIEEGEVVKVNE